MKKLKFSLIAIAIPILMSSCEDGPNLPNTRSYDTPILFETENMTWFTEYDMTNNIYSTTITSGEINYVVKASEEIPDGFVVTQVIKDKDGKRKNLNVGNIKKLAESENGFYKCEVDLLTFDYAEKGKFSISLEKAYDADYEYCHYFIVLESKDKKFGTQIKIDHRKLLDTGYFPLNFDLSEIKYPSKRHHNESTGHYKGYEYSIWLPSDECELELPTNAGGCYIKMVSLFSSLNSEEEILYQYKYNSDLPKTDAQNQPLKEILTEYGEFSFVEFNKTESALKSKIFENQSGQERKISIRIQGSCGGALINFIQAAK